ncbi:MAG: hypothetical protein K0S48_45 [Ramlibacter sp.]|jgi:hypothetical protein|nr:hypothetical protein [Ramlibacter sp.]
MPYETWRSDAVAHYVALARLPVPWAQDTARQLAEAAEASARPLQDGLVDEVRAELQKGTSDEATPDRN